MYYAHLKYRLRGSCTGVLLIVWDNLNDDIEGAVSIHFTVPPLRAR